ncbi:carotenoid 9-10-cleavage dioxygenase-like [Pyrus ussuriensis x Pyrus communis]|uniref:Carotenoid 9-10-cleavage dioxygenase-like n=1 Tax=Pyrus ussuriensis x Pyrus communis TaxID=2448454 RepID=A0A5N5HTQ2_9ROSA|nr:carotenoid 9-10-cleavage dioxygenase-like [Pyrus ussuriensis x Pyrus communis]
MASCIPFQLNCSSLKKKPSASENLYHSKSTLSSAFMNKIQPFMMGKMEQVIPMQIDVSKTFKYTSDKVLDFLVDSMFEFVDQEYLPSQSNFRPVDELGGVVAVTSSIRGKIPDDFPEGVYIRNGPNPLFGGFKSTRSVFGRSSHIWVEGEGMLHALYFSRDGDVSDGGWTVRYNNRHVETETFKLEKQRNKPSFLPAIGGDSPAILAAYLLNLLRFGKVNKYYSNTNVFEHSGKFYSVAENHIPQEIDIITLETLGNWDFSGAWNRPFTSHSKRAPGSEELVIHGFDAVKPYMEIGIISADGKELIHKVDLKLSRSSFFHELGITERYNVLMDFPLTFDINRLVNGGPLLEYNHEEYARIGVMPRYGNADSIRWFKVEPNCTFHIINCFEDGDEVVVWGCKALDSIIPGPDMASTQFGWLPRKFQPISPSKENDHGTISSVDDGNLLSHAYEWRLNMQSGEVSERYLTGKRFCMDFPMINGAFSGRSEGQLEEAIKVETHMFEENSFCTGASFVPKQRGLEEDDGWIITFVHNEDTNISQNRPIPSAPVHEIVLQSIASHLVVADLGHEHRRAGRYVLSVSGCAIQIAIHSGRVNSVKLTKKVTEQVKKGITLSVTTSAAPQLKVNINKQKKETFQILKPELDVDPEKNPHFDPDMSRLITHRRSVTNEPPALSASTAPSMSAPLIEEPTPLTEATLMPEPSNHTSSASRVEGEASQPIKKNTRGLSRMLKEAQSVRLTSSRIKIEYNPRHHGTTTSQQHNSVASSCGVVIKQNCPMKWESWAKIPKGTKKLVNFDLEDISPEAMAYLEETLATWYKHWKNYLHTHFKLSDDPEFAHLHGCPTELQDQQEDWEWLCKHFTDPKFVKKSIAGKIARDSKTLLHHSGSKPFPYRLKARRQEGSKFPEIDMFEDVYVRPGNETAKQLHLPPETPIEDVTVPEDASFQILTNVMDQNFGRRHGKDVWCMGKTRVRETGASSSGLNTAEVSALKEEETTLKGQLAVQNEQMRALDKQMRAQEEQIRAQGEQIRAHGEEMKTYLGRVRDLVRAIQMSSLQISLLVPDLATPSTSEPLRPADT